MYPQLCKQVKFDKREKIFTSKTNYIAPPPMFSADYIKNSVQNKRKRLEQLTNNALKSSSRTVDDIWKVQNNERYLVLLISFHKNIDVQK